MVGCIGVNQGDFEYSRSGEIGYWLAKEHWRKGIAQQAIKKITSEVFAGTDIVRIYACVFSQNLASMKLLEKTGFSSEAVFKRAIYKNETFYDNHIFSMLK